MWTLPLASTTKTSLVYNLEQLCLYTSYCLPILLITVYLNETKDDAVLLILAAYSNQSISKNGKLSTIFQGYQHRFIKNEQYSFVWLFTNPEMIHKAFPYLT